MSSAYNKLGGNLVLINVVGVQTVHANKISTAGNTADS